MIEECWPRMLDDQQLQCLLENSVAPSPLKLLAAAAVRQEPKLRRLFRFAFFNLSFVA